MPHIIVNSDYSNFNISNCTDYNNTNLNINSEYFNRIIIHPALYFILCFVGLIVIVCCYPICSEEIRIRKLKRYNRNRRDSDNQSWDDFVEEMEGHMDVVAQAFVASQNREEANKTENSKRINKIIETQNILNINKKSDRDKYDSFNFNDDKTECSICHELLIEVNTCPKTDEKYFKKLYMFPCGHTLHDECYNDYKMSVIVGNTTVFKCPICRS